MFDIACVELENFRSYRGRHMIDLPTTPGLYLITGINNKEPRLGANDVGKSTLLDAIYWCLYGRTTRGLKAGDVINWDEKSCGVTVYLTINDKALKITRTQNPNTLKLDGTTVSQELLQKHLRIGPEAFTYAVMVPQFGDSFFDLQPAAKLTLFSQIMELDFWLDKSHEAEALAGEIGSLKSSKEQSVSKYDGQIEMLTNDITQCKERHQDFAIVQARTVASLKGELEVFATGDLVTKKNLAFAEQALFGIEQKMAKLDRAAKSCPTCHQKVANKDLDGLLRNKADWERQLAQYQRQEAVRQSEEQSAKKSIAAEQNRTNPYAEQITEKQSAITKFKAKKSSLTVEIEQLDKDHAAVSYWINGFKKLRLFIVEETLRQLEVEVNNNMASLGLTDWRIEFDVERENKSGGVTKGFVVFVYAPGRPEPTRWEAWAGGVTQRLRLAGNLGLANLIMERAGLRNTIEFYDEPSRHLSQEGLSDVAETLHNRALSTGKRILMIDHVTIDFGDFAGRLFITKGPDGSYLRPAAAP